MAAGLASGNWADRENYTLLVIRQSRAAGIEMHWCSPGSVVLNYRP